jgi:hypothetical protein
VVQVLLILAQILKEGAVVVPDLESQMLRAFEL